MSPFDSWVFILVLFVVMPALVAHIALLLDERTGWMKRHEKWITDGVREDER